MTLHVSYYNFRFERLSGLRSDCSVVTTTASVAASRGFWFVCWYVCFFVCLPSVLTGGPRLSSLIFLSNLTSFHSSLSTATMGTSRRWTRIWRRMTGRNYTNCTCKRKTMTVLYLWKIWGSPPFSLHQYIVQRKSRLSQHQLEPSPETKRSRS